MTWTDIVTFAAVASLLVMSPGPNGVLIAKTVPTSGRAAGFSNVAGFMVAFYLHGAMSILGISLLLIKSAAAFTIVKYLGAAYLIWIGVKALKAAYSGKRPTADIAPNKRKRSLRIAFVEGFFTNALNPKVSMFYLAAFPQFITVGETSAMSSFLLVFVHSMINGVWFGAMVLVFSTLTKVAGGASFQRLLKGVTGVVFVGFGVKLASFKSNI